MVSKKVNVYNGLRTMRHEILCNFCYLFNNLILHEPFKNKDLYDTMVDTLKHLQVHAIPYKYCYLNASKCEYIVIFLTIYLKGRGYFLLAIKQLLLLPRGVLINSGIFTCPDQIHRCIYRRNYFPIWQQGEKRETISDPSSFISYE